MNEKLLPMSPGELRSIREALKKKQWEMAELLLIGLKGYQHWEYGERQMPPRRAALARKLLAESAHTAK